MLQLIFLLSLFSASISAPHDHTSKERATLNCGYNSCHEIKPDKLNVHLVPHSHDDVGWKKTFDQYYYGNNKKQHEGVRGVQDILNSVIYSLRDDPNRRFIQVETAYFSRWWESQTNDTKLIVQELVNDGRLEMVSGGWSMNDEAATNYQSIIDQMTLGLRTLDELLGECGRPRVGWQIDPFGHTNAMATILAELGFDGVFFWRLDYRDSEKRQNTKNTEFIWRGNTELGEKSDIFTSLLYENYNAPLYFCWDIQCGDTPIVDDISSPEYNLEERVTKFSERITKQASKYKTNNILITMGGDFTYQAAEMYYVNIDRLIKGFQKFRPDINMIYSTPSCYVKAVNDMANKNEIAFSLETNDFMPYASDVNSYWTGYYTSRPNSKRFERVGNNLLQTAKHLVAMENAKRKNYDNDLVELKQAMGVMQHHDAITGTEKQHVVDDYVRIMTSAMEGAQKSIQTIVFDLLKYVSTDSNELVSLKSCLLSNVTRCEQSNMDRFTVAVYNTHAQTISHFVRIPVVGVDYTVVGLHGGLIPHQVSKAIHTFSNVPGTESLFELTFEAIDLPPLGINYFYITKETRNTSTGFTNETDKLYLGTNITGFKISETTGLLESVTLHGVTQAVKQQFFYYKGRNGTNVSPAERASGAYIFRPNGEEAIGIADRASVTVYKGEGELFDEVHQWFNFHGLKQVIRVYKSRNYIEFDWIVGPITYVDELGIEVISRFITDLNTAGTFYTDSNGRQLIKRVRNQRPTYQYTNEEPISGNYYPVTSRIVIKDEEKKINLAVLNDRSQGGSSLKDGELELMIHRRLMNDDQFGVDEVLNELEYNDGVVVRGQHYLVLGTEAVSGPVQQVDLAHRLLLAPWTFVGNFLKNDSTFDGLRQKIDFQFSGLTKSLPVNVRMLSFEYLTPTSILLRLENPYSANDDPVLGSTVTVDLTDLFNLYTVKSVNETTLGSNQLKEANQRLIWRVQNETPTEEKNSRIDGLSITLNPMEIRTFILDVEAINRFPYGGSAVTVKLSYTLLTLFFVITVIFY